MQDLTHEELDLLEDASRFWWVFLVVGILWLWVALIVLRLDLSTVYAISIMFGLVAIGAGLNEFFAIAVSSGGWKWVHGILGVIFVAAGIVAFFRPTNTFVALAALVGWVLLFKGIFDLVLGFVLHPAPLWWIPLVVGVAQILIGFWAVGYFEGSAVLLVVWVGVLALIRGFTEIVTAFRLRKVKKLTLRPA
jgi:uncharacterized membrane protein HdeD (DUF308 family)